MIGRKGIGLGKRAPSPTELDRLAKVAKSAEDADKESFRDRSRREFEQRRAETRLGPAQRTCATLDERAGKEVSKRAFKICHHLSFFFPFSLPTPPPPPFFFSMGGEGEAEAEEEEEGKKRHYSSFG
jgi:hypothetical protein